MPSDGPAGAGSGAWRRRSSRPLAGKGRLSSAAIESHRGGGGGTQRQAGRPAVVLWGAPPGSWALKHLSLARPRLVELGTSSSLCSLAVATGQSVPSFSASSLWPKVAPGPTHDTETRQPGPPQAPLFGFFKKNYAGPSTTRQLRQAGRLPLDPWRAEAESAHPPLPPPPSEHSDP